MAGFIIGLILGGIAVAIHLDRNFEFTRKKR